MARIEITVVGPRDNRLEIAKQNPDELVAVAEAIGLLVAAYGPDLRAAMSEIKHLFDLFEPFLPQEGLGRG